MDKKNQKKNNKESHINLESKESQRIWMAIVGILIITMLITIIFSTRMIADWGDAEMQREAASYNYELSEWMTEQKSILDMFGNMIAANPGLMDNYEEAVTYLDNITKQYPEISVTYMANPEAEHTVIMNNGWEPEDDWKVEERQWYVDTEKSQDGFSISAPYYDEQTGLYCVTFSKIVYGQNGEFLGIFGIDFYLDKLTEILGQSYGKHGYAFLVDGDGVIINHPNSDYQLSSDNAVNIKDLVYNKIYNSTDIVMVKDYDHKYKAGIAKHESSSDFMVVVVKDWWSIYGNIIIYDSLFLILFSICIIAAAYLMRRLVKWQREVNIHLQETAESAIHAGKAKSQFLAQMSHEIRTPINAVLGMNEMILRECDNEDIKEYSENIQSAGRTLLALINSILDFSKIEDGKMEIIPADYVTHTVINDLVNMIADKAEKKDLVLHLEIDPNLPRMLYGDDVRIRQIITNLLTNAVKYTPEGSVTLKIQGIHRDMESICIAVEVIDTGIGIKEEDLDKLFLSFRRLDEEKNRNIEGTGLGIAIVQKLLEMMGSKLEVTSTYGKGSKFRFELTQKIVDATPIGNYELGSRTETEKKKEEKYIHAPEAVVLIVDDNEMNLKVAAGLFKRSGMRTDTAGSGRECINMVKKQQYDMIFLDHMMPDMDGVETLKVMKKEDILPHNTIVVALTANAIVGAREEYLALGFDDYLTKPIEIDELETLFLKYLPKDKITYKDTGKPQQKAEEITENVSDAFTQAELLAMHMMVPELDIITGIIYCAESKMFYMEMLKEYLKDSKVEVLERCWQEEDMENYRIGMHTLKSTSLNIGAVRLSEEVKQLEMAAREHDIAYIKEHHEKTLKEYKKLLSQLEEFL